MDKSNEQDQYKKGYEDAKAEVLELLEEVKNQLADKAKEVPIRKGFFWDGKAYGYIDAINTIYETTSKFSTHKSVLACAKTIQRFCSEVERCADCPLHAPNDPLGCALVKKDDCPEYWTFDESEEEDV